MALVQAPEICIEVISPSNTAEEIAEKRAKILEDMRAAILADDTPKVLAFAKALCGIENEREKTH